MHQDEEERAKRAGILQYTGTTPGIKGILKYRFHDFIVREIDSEGKPVELVVTEAAAPPPKEVVPHEDAHQRFDSLRETMSADDIVKLKAYVESGKDAASAREGVLLAAEDDKDRRTGQHKAVKQYLPELTSTTEETEDGRKCIRVIFAGTKAARGGKGKSLHGGWKQNTWEHPESYVRFHLLKENLDTMQAMTVLAKMLHLKPNCFSYAGTKDRRAVTVQACAAFKIEPSRLYGLNDKLRGARIGDCTFVKEPLRLGLLSGNRFHIVVRDIQGATIPQVEESVTNLKTHGFINYFGLQRFGTTSIMTHEIGRKVLQDDFQGALQLILTPRADERDDTRRARQYFIDTGDAKGAMRKFHPGMQVERTIMDVYARLGNNAHQNAFQALPRNLRLMYVHAYQSYVWNSVASRRVEQYGAKVAKKGDLVPVEEPKQNGEQDTIEVETKMRELSEEEAATTPLSRVVLPLVGTKSKYPGNDLVQVYEELLRADGLDMHNLQRTHKEYTMPGGYRFLLGYPKDLEWDMVSYSRPLDQLQLSDLDKIRHKTLDDVEPVTAATGMPTDKHVALRISFTLGVAQYATMCLREVLKDYIHTAFNAHSEDRSGEKDDKKRSHEDNGSSEDQGPAKAMKQDVPQN